MPEGWDPEIPPLLAEGISLGWEPLYWKYALSAVSIALYRRCRQWIMTDDDDCVGNILLYWRSRDSALEKVWTFSLLSWPGLVDQYRQVRVEVWITWSESRGINMAGNVQWECFRELPPIGLQCTVSLLKWQTALTLSSEIHWRLPSWRHRRLLVVTYLQCCNRDREPSAFCYWPPYCVETSKLLQVVCAVICVYVQ